VERKYETVHSLRPSGSEIENEQEQRQRTSGKNLNSALSIQAWEGCLFVACINCRGHLAVNVKEASYMKLSCHVRNQL
jgi:hypothetical protein